MSLTKENETLRADKEDLQASTEDLRAETEDLRADNDLLSATVNILTEEAEEAEAEIVRLLHKIANSETSPADRNGALNALRARDRA